ncbi:sortase domain-bontaining protein [Rossellomorea sp. BNER]|uniref:class F sortase n=1 Tax=Rossellomorea sp. BNER TaxID=2962031 RepID=UPI003AF2053A|nr:class F sortase [Rossellomorea sp. BNER]
MKKRMLISIITILIISIIGFQAFAKEDSIKQEQQSESKPEKPKKEKQPNPAAHIGEEFVLLDPLKKKKTVMEEHKKIQEEGITPTRIQIPSMEIDTNVIPVGLKDNGEMDVPEKTTVVGWYDRGPKPGGIGNSVVAGHVDSEEGPAIFFYLKNIEIGENIILSDKNGIKRTFVVTSKESYKSEEAPIKKIFGPSNKRQLNVITCTGTFDYENHLYPERLVVYTELVDEPTQQEIPVPEAPTNVEMDSRLLTWYAVRNDTVIGYRVYKKWPNDKGYQHVASVSAHEKKSFFDENAQKGTSYYVTTVDLLDQESKPSLIVTSP